MYATGISRCSAYKVQHYRKWPEDSQGTALFTKSASLAEQLVMQYKVNTHTELSCIATKCFHSPAVHNAMVAHVRDFSHCQELEPAK